jgi:hypothetical protein
VASQFRPQLSSYRQFDDLFEDPDETLPYRDDIRADILRVIEELEGEPLPPVHRAEPENESAQPEEEEEGQDNDDDGDFPDGAVRGPDSVLHSDSKTAAKSGSAPVASSPAESDPVIFKTLNPLEFGNLHIENLD